MASCLCSSSRRRSIGVTDSSASIVQVGSLHHCTITALYRLDKNENLLEIFAHTSNNRAFYRPKLNL